MTTRDASHTERELLKRLQRGALAQLTALQQLPERSPEDDLRLRASSRLVTRLRDRIQAMENRAMEDLMIEERSLEDRKTSRLQPAQL